MDRDVFLGNRVVNNYMQEREKKRLKQRLKYIRHNRSEYSSMGLIKDKPRANSLFFEKNQQIQKQNIALFNRIASIIKKNPKIATQSQSSMQKSRQTSILFHRKIQSSLEEQNKLIQKRLTSQKPTINNKLFYQQRAKHMKYLKTMGRYPYILNKKLNTEPDVNAYDQVNINTGQFPPITNIKSEFSKHQAESNVKELFRHQSLDFSINVSLDLKADMCTFAIQSNQQNSQSYLLNVPKAQFIQYFQQSDYDYEKMIGNLRLNDEGHIEYVRDKEKQNRTNQTPKQEKQVFKFRAQSTAYTSTGFKTGFRSNKRNLQSKNELGLRENSKTDRKFNKFNQEKLQNKKETDALSEDKFAQINLLTKNK